MIHDWQIRNRTLPIGGRTLVMGILNVTPDSFSDGGEFLSPEQAIERAEQMISEGADIIDVGGESTRPGSKGPVLLEEEIERVIPVISLLSHKTDIPISIDTTKSEVARKALGAGAAIVNDVSALRFDFYVADVAAEFGAGLILMHSRGTPGTMHRLPPVADIIHEVTSSLRTSVQMAERRGVKREAIVIDPGIGFGKTQEQNLELIAKLDQLSVSFPDLPILIGTSRKSFLGRILEDESGNPAPVEERLHGSMASITAAIMRGANIVRVHDVKEAVAHVKTVDAIRSLVATQTKNCDNLDLMEAKKKKPHNKVKVRTGSDSEDETKVKPESEELQLKPVTPKIGETTDNLKQRADWFQKRSGK